MSEPNEPSWQEAALTESQLEALLLCEEAVDDVLTCIECGEDWRDDILGETLVPRTQHYNARGDDGQIVGPGFGWSSIDKCYWEAEEWVKWLCTCEEHDLTPLEVQVFKAVTGLTDNFQ